MAFKQVPPHLQVLPTEKIQSTFKRLSQAAADLNTASDELSKPVRTWEAALKKLNLGVSAWVHLSEGGEEGGEWWDRSIGYTKIKGVWCIAIRTREAATPVDVDEEIWTFNEAPRWMRAEAVVKLPDLLEALLKQAEDTTQQIKKKTAQANELADAIEKVAGDSKIPVGLAESLIQQFTTLDSKLAGGK